MKRLYIACLLLLCTMGLAPVVTGAKPALGPDFEAIDAFVRREMDRHRIPGLALAVVRGDDIVHLNGFGSAGDQRPVTPRTPFYIGSISKSVTAVAVMQLVEAGRIDLDAPVQAYLPWFRVADDAASSAITVRHLLNQTSGLSEATYMVDLPPTTSLEEAVRDLHRAEPVAPPGDAFHYFNQNYTTLGLLVETVAGQPYGEYVREHIFEPLAMDDSAATAQEIGRLNVAQGHGVLFGFPLPRDEEVSDHGMPKGGIVSTAEDMAHYLIAQLNDGAYRDASILSPEAVVELHRPETPGAPPGEGYGMGWIVEPKAGTRVVHHGGSLDNFRAFAWLLPEEDYGFVVLINQNGFVPTMLAYSQIPEGIARLLVDNDRESALPSGMAMRTVYWIITAVFAIVALADLYGWWTTRRARQHTRLTRPTAKLAVGAAGASLRAAVWYGLPYVVLSGLGRGFRWSLGWTMAPTVILFAWWNIVMGAAHSLVRAWALMRKDRARGL